jgi:hypothetical protein
MSTSTPECTAAQHSAAHPSRLQSTHSAQRHKAIGATGRARCEQAHVRVHARLCACQSSCGGPCTQATWSCTNCLLPAPVVPLQCVSWIFAPRARAHSCCSCLAMGCALKSTPYLRHGKDTSYIVSNLTYIISSSTCLTRVGGALCLALSKARTGAVSWQDAFHCWQLCLRTSPVMLWRCPALSVAVAERSS